MNNQKPLQFQAGALDYFILSVLSIVLAYIPFLGWAFLLNYSGEWFADRTLVTGKKITFKAGFGESLKFVFVNFLLIVITIGIYSFWFYPKMYRYMADHTSFAEDVAVNPVVDAAPAQPVAPESPAPEVPAVPVATDGVPAEEPQQPTAPTVPRV